MPRLPPYSRAAHQVREHGGELTFEFFAVSNEIDEAVLEEELGALEAFGEFAADGLLDHAGSGKADEGLGFGDDHIT